MPVKTGEGDMLWPRIRGWAAYLLAVTLEAALTAGLILLNQVFPLPTFPVAYFLLTMLIAYWLGVGPAVLSVFLGWLAFAYFFVPPPGLWPLADSPQSWAAHAALLLGTIMAAITTIQWRMSNQRTQMLADESISLNATLREQIREREQAQEALRESEGNVRKKLDSILSPEGDIGDLELADIIDAPAVQSLMDSLYKLVPIPMALIDLKGKVLVGVGWQDICTKFHRIHPETCRHCIESDMQLSVGVAPGEFKLYKCKNGMWDVATPVVIGGKHLGNLFSGQFFFEDEALDYEFFRSQARRYGFDEEAYIAALDSVPRLPRKTLEEAMTFFAGLADMLSKLSYSNIKLARSLSERDALTESLRQSEAILEQRVAQRTAELENVNQELEAFSYSVSHDLRAPLRAIDGFSNTILKRYRDSLDPQGQDYLDRVRAAAQRMSRLIDDILGLSRAGRAEMRRQNVDMSAVASEVIEGLRESQPERNVEISIQQGMTVHADPNLLRIVLDNLLDNAWKFTGKREAPRIEVGVLDQDGEQVYYVRDNGAGFNPERADKLFAPFQRLHTESEFAGTGIGLALVQRIIRRHGGRIWAEGEEGQGAAFYFTLGEADT